MAARAQEPLSAVLDNEGFSGRPYRPPSRDVEVAALRELADELLYHPERILQKLVDMALELSSAGSAGISLLEGTDGAQHFRWHAVAGEFRRFRWETMPRDGSPCGTVLDLQSTLFMIEPERHFLELRGIEPKIAEALLVPFRVAGRAVGTLWVVAHDGGGRHFDREDRRLVTSLSTFAAKAYEKLLKDGRLHLHD